ncbi:MAG TPA: rod shape-determining protein RodA [Candidatus Hydrogenedens sp.]|nr:rod shape-determining protein RodA [Candidatus Hydrogenedens sp.]HOK10324.1 rod shape-determining protein RodA [Candidatus Hydrogenedens sp.]HOL20310.1 rod shape-determining protein RodA [Candidatus Hydrogenedens sp.]HPP59849.1 rod shape-determining protein RodA [Candidatus Hydrogenedens sp.]
MSTLEKYLTPTQQIDFDIEDSSIRIIDWRRLKKFDVISFLLIFALVVIGWINMYSACQSEDYTNFRNHVMIFFITIPILLFILIFDFHIIIALSPILYILSILLLLSVLFFGVQAKGSERWIPIGSFRFQPSEINKIIIVLTLTWYFGKLGERIKKLHWYILTFIISGIPIFLILLQPNLGTAMSLVPITMIMLWVAGCRLWHWLATVIAGLVVILFLFLEVNSLTIEQIQAGEHPKYLPLKPHQLTRIYTFFHPEADIRGSGWQTYQSRITIGSGGIYGKGFRQGTQTRLKYLPEHHTDFIFSLFAEEHGFYKSSLLIILYGLLLLRFVQLAFYANELKGKLLVTGVATIFLFHIFVNIAITMGVLPVTGLPLPFLSYGRSFYLTCIVGVGLIYSVPREKSFLFAG